MLIRFTCSNCHGELSAPEGCEGRSTKCRMCGQPVQVPGQPPKPPETHPATSTAATSPILKDKTALGQVVAHAPTNLDTRGSMAKAPPPQKMPPSKSDKTALGQAISHTPTGLKPIPEAVKSVPPTRKTQAKTPTHIPIARLETPSRVWMLYLAVLLVLSSGVLAFGVFWFISSPSSLDPEQSHAQGKPYSQLDPSKDKEPVKKQDEIPPLKKEIGKEPAPKVDPEKDKEPVKKQEEIPPPKKEIKQPPKAEIPIELVGFITKLQTGTTEEKVKATEDLAGRGENARPAARALCEAAIDSSKDVSRSALQALEKVTPDLHGAIFTLVVDGQADNHRKAIANLRKQGSKAKPAIPVMIHQIEKCQNVLKEQVKGFGGGGGWGSSTLIDVITDHLTALPEIAPEAPEVLKTVIGTTTLSFGQAFFSNKRGNPTATPFRSTGISLLGSLGTQKPEHRKKIIPELVTILEESVKLVNQKDPRGQRTLLDSLAEVESVSIALLRCGPDAKETLAEKVIPQLKDLEFHEDSSVRSAAKDLRKRIEAGPALKESGFPVNGRLAEGEQKRFPCSMRAGTTYVIDLQSRDFDAFLRLENDSGRLVAQDDDSGGGLNARIVFECTKSGDYVIIASSLQNNGSGTYLLEVRER